MKITIIIKNGEVYSTATENITKHPYDWEILENSLWWYLYWEKKHEKL